MERLGVITFAGNDVTVIGDDILIGNRAPEFTAQAQDWTLINVLEQTKGKVRIIAAVPSLSTSVCDREARTFNEQAVNLGEKIAIIVISNDLPFTQKHWVATAGVDRVTVVSDHMGFDFGKKYGCLIKELGILRRAVFVIDQDDVVTYVDYMKTIGDEPDYSAVIEAAKAVL